MAFLVPDRVLTVNGVKLNEYFLTQHNPNKIAMPELRTKALVGITIHNTEKITVKGTTMSEQYTRATVNGNMRDVRVHYYVDDTEIWQNLPNNWCGWHAADGSGKGNTATLAIEVIGNSAKAEDNAARLAACLLSKYGFTLDNLYTHTYWLNMLDKCTGSKDFLCTLPNPRKYCPAYILPHWTEFLCKVDGYLPDKVTYSIQVGAFSSRENAENYLKSVKKNYPNAFIRSE